MIETLFLIDEILCVISIFALGFFCVVIPKTGIAKYFYILFGITVLPIGLKFVLEDMPWYQYIWVFIFSIVAIIVGIRLFIINKRMTKEERVKFDKEFGDMSRRGGMRRV